MVYLYPLPTIHYPVPFPFSLFPIHRLPIISSTRKQTEETLLSRHLRTPSTRSLILVFQITTFSPQFPRFSAFEFLPILLDLLLSAVLKVVESSSLR